MKKKTVKKRIILLKLCLLIIIGSVAGYLIFMNTIAPKNDIEEYNIEGMTIQHNFLTPNPYSRGQSPLNSVKGIVVHYTANPGSSAQNNRDYFESQKTKKQASVSSHFIVGLKGEIIQCIPLNEVAYASNNRNKDTISIEVCHPDKTGKFNNETYKTLQKLVRSLLNSYGLDKNDVIRHYDVTGKACPKYFVDNPNEWEKFLNSL